MHSSEAVYCSIMCSKSATCKAFYFESSNCYESNGSGLVAAWAGSGSVKAVWLAPGKYAITVENFK